MSGSQLSVVILAAGKGTRMRSRLPKVLQPLGGSTLLEHVFDGIAGLDADTTYAVYGHGGELVPDTLSHRDVRWVRQTEQLGTGHAVEQALPEIPDDHVVLILNGDVPLVRAESLQPLVEAAADGRLALLTAFMPDPTGYGRILRDGDGRVTGIVEHKDATAEQRRIDEINTGLIACRGDRLRQWIGRLDRNNAQGEYYLTDVLEMAPADGVAIEGLPAADASEVQGVNDRIQLAACETALRRREAEVLMRAGVNLRDPERVDIRGRVRCGTDVQIDIGVVLEGDVHLADGVRLGPYTVIRDSRLGAGTVVEAHSVIEGADIDNECAVGPFARVRPETRMAERAKIGNFVETKKATIGPGSKINHLSYVGDAELGRDVNIGAGTITCNYDGANKHRTVIGDEAFIGSGTQLVAPVTVGEGATIGAGSTISRDAPAGTLTLTRVKQKSIEGWQRPKKKDESEK